MPGTHSTGSTGVSGDPAASPVGVRVSRCSGSRAATAASVTMRRGGRFAVSAPAALAGPEASVCLRPEDIAFAPAAEGPGPLGRLTPVTYAGPFQDCIVEMEQSGVALRAHVAVRPWQIGDRVAVRLPAQAAVLAPAMDDQP